MTRHVNTAIIGAGSSGLSALSQVKKTTDSFVLIDPGPLGSTCARVGCMPSKALINVANAYHQRKAFEQKGINGAENLKCDIPVVMRHVRALRDRFTSGMVEATEQMAGGKFIQGKAVLEGPQHIRVGEIVFHAQRVIIATGSNPVVPSDWKSFADRILTSETIFEQIYLPRRMAIIGLGAIGLELGQALSRLGVNVFGFSLMNTIGGISDPDVNAAAIKSLEAEFPMYLGHPANIREINGALEVTAGSERAEVDSVLVAMGVRPCVEGLGLEHLGLPLNKQGLPPFNPNTMQVGDLPVFIAGDVNGYRPILHEAVDEGLITGFNATAETPKCYCRRSVLGVVFSDPQIAVVGHSFEQLKDREFITGSINFENQARAMIEGSNMGMLKLYVDPSSARLLGCEMAVPEAEHLAHLLALAVQQELTVFDLLRMPFYHPTVEEGLRTALRDAVGKLPHKERNAEFYLCNSCPEKPLC